MSKKHILVWIEEPKVGEGEKLQYYRGLMSGILHPTNIPIRGGVACSSNCWLLSREDDVGALAKIVCAAADHELKYGVRFLSED